MFRSLVPGSVAVHNGRIHLRLALLHRVNVFVDGILGYHFDDGDFFGLPDSVFAKASSRVNISSKKDRCGISAKSKLRANLPVASVFGLQIIERIEIEIVLNARIRGRQVQS